MSVPASIPRKPSRHAVVIGMPPRRRRRRWPWIAGVLAVLFIAAVLEVRHVLSQAGPILRARVIQTLETRFHSKVELAELQVSINHGLEVSGKGLKIFGLTDPNPTEPGIQPLLAAAEFRFQTPARDLFKPHMRLHSVWVKGMVLNVPPSQERKQLDQFQKRSGKMSIFVDEFVCEDTQLIINTRNPEKLPLLFAISRLILTDVGPAQPLEFDATLVNPKPTGDIRSKGHFGPFRESAPRMTPVDGVYRFTDADLSTLKGIRGILSSTGKYAGTLGRILVDGETDTPDFQLDTGGRAVALHTDFHAIVDGTEGDTYLEPVRARFLHTSFTAQGKVVKVQNPPGHDIALAVVLDHARVDDLLRLGVKTDPPVMSGDVAMRAKLNIEPGPASVTGRMRLEGTFEIPAALFSNPKVQDRIDSLSLRSQGEPKLEKEHVVTNAPSSLMGSFRLDQRLLTFSSLKFSVPGTTADLTGQYSLDGQRFDFSGRVRMEAKLSQMTTGWKSLLLKPVDPFFHKHGAGTEAPIRISGTRSAPHFGHEKDREPTSAKSQ